jgi:predicted transcriptional regulator
VAAELKDFRGKITEETYLALEAESVASNRDRADIAREILHAWANRKIHEAKILNRLLRKEGFIREDDGGGK